MLKRSKLPARKSKKMFSRTADRIHSFNVQWINPMRGGIRM